MLWSGGLPILDYGVNLPFPFIILSGGRFVANLRCTGRLLKRLKEKPAATLSEPENRLGDWYANVLNIGRHRLVIAMSERTLLTVVVPIRDSKRLRERLRESTHELLFALGIPAALAADEVRGMERMPFGKTANRSVLGSMNDMTFQAEAYFASEPEVVYLNELLIYLNDTPCGPLDYSSPIWVTREVFGLSARGGPEWKGRDMGPPTPQEWPPEAN